MLFISAVFAEEMTLYQITPNILLPWVVYISTQLEYKYCLSFTFFLSLANDLLNPQLLGFTTILFVLVSHFVYKYNSTLNKDKFSSVLFSLLLINFAFYLVKWLYFAITSSEPFALLGKIMLTIAYNTILSCLVIVTLFLINKLKIVIYD